MKLVNPSGRNMETFETQAYGCVCSANNGNYTSGRRSSTGCQCSNGSINRSANRSAAGN